MTQGMIRSRVAGKKAALGVSWLCQADPCKRTGVSTRMLYKQISDNDHGIFLVGGLGFRKLGVWDISGIIPGRLTRFEASRLFGCLPKNVLLSSHPVLWWSSVEG